MSTVDKRTKILDLLALEGEILAENEEVLIRTISKKTGIEFFEIKEILRELKQEGKMYISQTFFYPETNTIQNAYHFGKEKKAKIIDKWRTKFDVDKFPQAGEKLEEIKKIFEKKSGKRLINEASIFFLTNPKDSKSLLYKILKTNNFNTEKYSLNFYINNPKLLSREILVDFVSLMTVLSMPQPRKFSLKEYWKSYYHGKRKPRAYPSGWKK